MLVLHANWSAGALHVWAESSAQWHAAPEPVSSSTGDGEGGVAVLAGRLVHPFAATVDAIASGLTDIVGTDLDVSRAGELVLELPVRDADPGPSDRFRSAVGAVDVEPPDRLSAVVVPAIGLAPADAIDLLVALESPPPRDTLEIGHDLVWWRDVARVVLELLSEQRYVPSLVKRRADDLRAIWQPWVHEEPLRSRVGRLLLTMPPAIRAVAGHDEVAPWPILDEALRSMTDALVRRTLIARDFPEAVDGRDPDEDAHVAWLVGLLGTNDEIARSGPTDSDLLRDVGRWLGQLEDPGQRCPLRLGLTLHEPDPETLPDTLSVPGDAVRWRLSLALVGTGEDPVRIDAEDLFNDASSVRRAATLVRRPEELLLAELGRAARLYEPLESLLAEAQPIGLDLTTAQAAGFLGEHRALLTEAGFAVEVPSWWGEPAARIGARLVLETPSFSGPSGTGAASRSLLGLNSLVSYEWQVAVGDQPLRMEEFRALAEAGQAGSLVRLHGRWVEVQRDLIEEAARFFDAHPGGEMSLLDAIHIAHGAGHEPFGLPILGLEASGWVADLLGASSGEGGLPKLEAPQGFLGTLRPYQRVGLNWLAFLDQFGLGACLADDMGLGKTIQLIALLLAEREAAPDTIGPTLLVVPTSVIGNWQRELERFAPSITVHVNHGPDRPVGDQLATLAEKTDVLITTYTLVSRDRESLMRINWHRVVLDEAQYIKNPPTKQTATIRALKTTRRVALTGTPVENRLSELWSIMEFCNPGYLGPPAEFRRRFGVPVERHRDRDKALQLRQLVRPFILRRLKTDPTVIDDLPPCVTTKEFAHLTPEQAARYEEAVNRMLGEVGHAEGIQRRGLVLATLVRLKQICNHPLLIERDAKGNAAIPTDPHEISRLGARSGKTRRLMSMLEEVMSTGDKALIFTQFRQMGHLLAAMIQHDLETDVLFLHGGTPPARRQQMIDRFQASDGGVPIFVLSLRAGGIGVNLTAANHVFHFDRWWNPAVENQATDRAFRIGQMRTVHVHKFVCAGTLEERIDQMIERKTELAQNIIGAGEDWLTELSTGQLRELLTLRYAETEADG